MSDISIKSHSEDFVDPLSDYGPAEYGSNVQRALVEDSVLAIRMQPCAQLPSETPARLAVQVLRDLKVSSLLVVDNERLVGIFTERDVMENIAERFSRVAEMPIREFMTAKPIVVYECDPAATALAAIAVGGYRHVPVLSMADKVLGIVSPKRVFEFLDTRVDATES